ncbi:Predicted kinase [Candidatus Kryptobacter tengchongensis]|uniref:Predicted kinase n=1 Tax=Kryptobacter tengchongensis TaxID=1643429 RepID=A0A916LK86_KRYT1|nr:AAA family ATPase [Candidatus Kryptobacter tengchongensis]CUS83613.1 Predicted kinase [Candidatus Kryptobacter tengchongensis]CUT04061.1 Predicted kinase [Candidatus Kryptobacter tengchongensis]CUU07847.1 Predicted kinase [Candidatus Kryptobacter tengchongensis]
MIEKIFNIFKRKNEQKETLKIKINPRTLVVLCGVAGSGKSTFAKKFFKRTQIVSSDHCRALISDNPANQAVSKHAFDLFYFIIEKRLLVGRLTVADATSLSKETRRQLIEIGRKYGFKIAIIIFDIPLEICIERDKKRPRKVGEQVIRNQYINFLEAKKSIPTEGFDEIFILNEETLDTAVVEIIPTYVTPNNSASL